MQKPCKSGCLHGQLTKHLDVPLTPKSELLHTGGSGLTGSQLSLHLGLLHVICMDQASDLVSDGMWTASTCCLEENKCP